MSPIFCKLPNGETKWKIQSGFSLVAKAYKDEPAVYGYKSHITEFTYYIHVVGKKKKNALMATMPQRDGDVMHSMEPDVVHAKTCRAP